jgi:hypothetical protein
MKQNVFFFFPSRVSIHHEQIITTQSAKYNSRHLAGTGQLSQPEDARKLQSLQREPKSLAEGRQGMEKEGKRGSRRPRKFICEVRKGTLLTPKSQVKCPRAGRGSCPCGLVHTLRACTNT